MWYLISLLALFICAANAKFAMVTLAIGDQYIDAVSIGFANKQTYAALHGYDFIISHDRLDPSRDTYWQKLRILNQTLLTNKYEWVLWTDADALIMNTAVKLEDLVDDQHDLIISYDWFSNVVNSGHFLLKNSQWGRDFLNRVYSYSEFITHKWPDNQAIITDVERYPTRVKIVQQRIMNSYLSSYYTDHRVTYSRMHYEVGDFILHLAGCSLKGPLKQLMTFYATKVVHDPCLGGISTYMSMYTKLARTDNMPWTAVNEIRVLNGEYISNTTQAVAEYNKRIGNFSQCQPHQEL